MLVPKVTPVIAKPAKKKIVSATKISGKKNVPDTGSAILEEPKKTKAGNKKARETSKTLQKKMANNKSSGKNTKNDNLPGLIVKGSASQANDQKGIQLKSKKNSVNRIKKVFFQLRFHTSFGQELFVSGNHPLLGNGDIEKAVPMQYFDEEHWNTSIEFKDAIEADTEITYQYILKNIDGSISYDWGTDKKINFSHLAHEEILCIDSWNFAGYYENTFYTEPFEKVLLNHNKDNGSTKIAQSATHLFKVKAPLLTNEQTICIIGNCKALGNWDTEKPVLLNRTEAETYYTLPINLGKESFPIAYKYGIYDTKNQLFVKYEAGDNRTVFDYGTPGRLTILNDGFALLPNNTWKGAGVAVPVFSLRSENSFGVGEFTDMKLLVDWSEKLGLKMIQILPINDTTATNTYTDSYPYAAISAFALHPLYLNLKAITDEANAKALQKLEKERKRLNALDTMDYVAVTKIKTEFARLVYAGAKEKTLASKEYQQFFTQNQHWLVPYAAFCYLRDQYGTVDFNQWPGYKQFNLTDIEELTNPSSKAFSEIAFYYFVQYHLHLQLKEATAYAHKKGIIVKGDIAIGVYRNGVDAWQNPQLYHLDFQAGAPPDDFAVKGQNWGFPTYNWQRMREDGFAWWKQRFEQMSYYFDAFRIDHILGFFRIWSIPMNAVEGIMGHFVPAIPIHINEFYNNHIWFDRDRYTKPYITENVLWEVFGYDNELVKSLFLKKTGTGMYELKAEYRTQRLVEAHFKQLDQDTHHAKIRQGLYNLISNVILFDSEEADGQYFHFRFGIEETSSFRNLEAGTREQLKNLYVNYFFRRQDDFWMKEALQKLPALKRVTNMLVCGEDLGLVPDCVPDVMKQLGLLSLEIQRMPKDPAKEFFHPNDAPYLSVVTPATHDMSTIRGWWEEDKEKVQHFYNHELGQFGEAPFYCEAWINKAIVLQHLYSPAMWTVFQLQDLLGMDETLRRSNPAEERINIPADPHHYWRYRMHLTLETLNQASDFNQGLLTSIKASGR